MNLSILVALGEPEKGLLCGFQQWPDDEPRISAAWPNAALTAAASGSARAVAAAADKKSNVTLVLLAILAGGERCVRSIKDEFWVSNARVISSFKAEEAGILRNDDTRWILLVEA